MKMENSQNSTINWLRATGLFTKGVVYGLIGILTAMFPLGLGGNMIGYGIFITMVDRHANFSTLG